MTDEDIIKKDLITKTIDCLQRKHDNFIGNLKEDSETRKAFKEGLAWAIDTIKTLEEKATFEEVSRVLIKHLNDPQAYNPHHTVIVDSTHAELMEGCKSIKTFDYLKD